MKLTLVTYESIVAYNAGYAHKHNVSEFIKELSKLIEDFAAAVGVPKEVINWKHVTHSDWCKEMLIIWAHVPTDWEPKADTQVLDKEYYHNWNPDTVFSLSSWIYGYSNRVNCKDYPPSKPHKLFKTVSKDF